MGCEACGGDGQIEYGAYRGDESDTTTRRCRLCGGAVTATTLLTDTADSASNHLTQAASGVVVSGPVKQITVDEVSDSLRRELSREPPRRRLQRRTSAVRASRR